MNRKWIVKLSATMLAFMLVTACGTTNDNDNNDMDPIEDQGPANDQDNNLDDNQDNDNLGPDDNRDNDNLDRDDNFDDDNMNEDRDQNDNLNE